MRIASREMLEDSPITTVYKVEFKEGDLPRYYTADELTLITAFMPLQFRVKTISYKDYLDIFFGKKT
jgi:hypothetical protein